MLTDREVAKLYPLRQRAGVPTNERAEIERQWHSHWLDHSQAESMAHLMPQGAEEASSALVMIGKSIEQAGRLGIQEKGTNRQALYDDPMQRFSNVPGTIPKMNRVSPGLLRGIGNEDPIIISILQILKNRITRYCRPIRSGLDAMLQGSEGFDVWPEGVNSWDELNEEQNATREEIINWVLNSGDVGRMEGYGKPNRETLRRDSLKRVASQYVEERFILDAYALEIEYTRNHRKLSGLYVVDGATILRTDARVWPFGIVALSEENLSASYVQIWQNRAVATFGSDDMIYEYANPRSVIGMQGYGFSETEMSLRLTTGILNVLNSNNALFDRNAIPPGILALKGNINAKALHEFAAEWDSYRMGAGGQYGLPAINIRDPQGKIEYVNTGGMPTDMTNSVYISFLTAIRCATFGIDVTEINSSPFGGNNSALNSGKDTQTRLDEGKNRTVPPMVEGFFAPYQDLIKIGWPSWKIFPVGLRKEDPDKLNSLFAANATVNEVRRVKLKMPDLPGVQGQALSANPGVSQMVIAGMGHGNIDADGNGVPDGEEKDATPVASDKKKKEEGKK